jgi:hypothetical protein
LTTPVLEVVMVPPRSPGSKSLSDILWALLTFKWRRLLDPTPGNPECYEYSCFLKGGDGYPPRWRQGWFSAGADRLAWCAATRTKGLAGKAIDAAAIRGVREVTGSDRWRIKDGLFRVIDCEDSNGSWFELAVPAVDVAAVRTLLVMDRRRRETGVQNPRPG